MTRCQVILRYWTLPGLVGAFLDLAVAYFLLCCSATAFFVAQFLAFFGLSLPCPCNGLFGYPNRIPCAQRFLVDYPAGTVSNLQWSVKSKCPFDTILAWNDQGQLNMKLVKESKIDEAHEGALEFDGSASYSSFSDPRRSHQSLSGGESLGKFDIKGKGVASQRQRGGNFRHRRRGSVDYAKFTSGSSYDLVTPDVRVIHRSPSGPDEIGNDINLEYSKPVNSHGKNLSDIDSNDATDEGKLMYGNPRSFEYGKTSARHEVDVNDENAIKILEQALEEEQAARVTLWSELEQERIAAATATDEAMAMISRLQEEKAAIEIEACQYQRILEEKSSYDAEEMDILKEIIIRREREKHFLEREVEACRKLLHGNDGLEGQLSGVEQQNEASFPDSSFNPMLILQQLSENIDRRGRIQNESNPDYASDFVESHFFSTSSGKEESGQWDADTVTVKEIESPACVNVFPDHSQYMDVSNQDIQEKGILSVDETTDPQSSMTSNSTRHGILENDVLLQVGESHVHDVHVVDSKNDISIATTKKEAGPLPLQDNTQNIQRTGEGSFEASKELGISRSCSDIVHRLSSMSSLPNVKLTTEMRRNSLPTMDYERFKIDSEIDWLRSRLRIVQDEKEKLKTSLDRQERGKVELQLLEDIASQIREIRHLTEPEKAARLGSLPPLSSKVTSKKRRSRNISIGLNQSKSS